MKNSILMFAVLFSIFFSACGEKISMDDFFSRVEEGRTRTCTDLPSNAAPNSTSTITQIWDGANWVPSTTYSYSTTASNTNCHFMCNDNYAYVASTNSCNANSRSASCTALPGNASWNNVNTITQTWGGTAWLPSHTGEYNANSSTTLCYFACNNNYLWSGANCNYDLEGVCNLTANHKWYNNQCVESQAPGNVTIYVENISSYRTWFSLTAPGDNNNTDSASAESYEILYATQPFDSQNLNSVATTYSGDVPSPSSKGTFQMFNINGLTPGQTYYVAVRSRDQYENKSELSNVVTFKADYGMTGYIGWGRNGWQMVTNREMLPAIVLEDDTGEIYVADQLNNRIIKFDSNKNFVGWIGGGKSGWQAGGLCMKSLTDPNYFYEPSGLAIDSDNNIYVADFRTHSVSRWNSNGYFTGWLGCGQEGWQTGDKSGSCQGTTNMNMYYPTGLAIDNQGRLLVTELLAHRVSVWNINNATYLGWFGGGSDGLQYGNAPSNGTAAKTFDRPSAVAIDNSGNIFIHEDFNNRIQKWDSDFNFIGWTGHNINNWQTGSSKGDISSLNSFSMAVDDDGNLYAINGPSIGKWNSDGAYIGWLGNGNDEWQTGHRATSSRPDDRFLISTRASVSIGNSGVLYVGFTEYDTRFMMWNSNGAYIGWVNGIDSGIQTGSEGAVTGYDEQTFSGTPSYYSLKASSNGYLYYNTASRVERWKLSDGTYMGWIGGGQNGWQSGAAPATGSNASEINAKRILPHGDYIYIAEASRIQRWTSGGVYTGWIGGGNTGWQTGASPATGTGDGEFNIGTGGGGMSVLEETGDLLVVDAANRIQKWNLNGTFLGWWGKGSSTTGWHGIGSGETSASGNGDSEFNFAMTMDLDNDGNMYIVEYMGRVSKYNSDGSFIGAHNGNPDYSWVTGAGFVISYFQYPCHIDVDVNGHLYVCGYNSALMMRWHSGNANFAGWLGVGEAGWHYGDLYTPTGGLTPGQPMINGSCTGITSDSDGRVYWLDAASLRIMRWE